MSLKTEMPVPDALTPSQILPLDHPVDGPFGEIPPAQYGALIRRVRASLGLTQPQLAAKLSVTRPTIARWEGGGVPDARVLPAVISFVREALIDAVVTEAAEFRSRVDLTSADFKDLPLQSIEAVEAELRRQAEPAADLYANIISMRGHVRAARGAWTDLLGMPARFFDGVPRAAEISGEPYYWGFDVGSVLEASLRGQAYSEFVKPLSSRFEWAHQYVMAARLVNECDYRWHWRSQGLSVSWTQPGFGKRSKAIWADLLREGPASLRPMTPPKP